MFDRLIHFSIHNKLIIGILTLALVAWGGYSLSRLPIDAVPDITTNQIVVYTVAPSLAASDIERLVSFPVEQSLATIPNREEVRSFSRFGLSVVTIVFEDGVDIYWARQQVAERLREAESQIPESIGRPEMAPVSTGLGEVYQYLVRAKPGFEKKYDARELRTIQDWIVRRQLLGTPGVADVASFGGQLKQFEIRLDPTRLRSLGVTTEQVYQAVSRNNQNAGGAYLDQKPTAYFIRTEGLAENAADLGNIVVRNTEGGLPVLVRDVADVRLGSAVRYGAMTRNGEGEVTGGIVLMLKGANANDVIKDVKTRMLTVEKSLPEGVAIDVYLDRSELVGRAIGTVKTNLIEGALIVLFVLILFLGNWRAGLVVASVIPLAMLFAIAMMRLFGVSGNLLSLGAIDFGLVVDGAVIIVEAIVHRLHGGQLRVPGNRLSTDQMNEETYHAASKIRSSAAFGEIIILIVYLPLLALVGIEGKMFRPMAQTVAFAIIGAFILSLTYVPMMSALALSRSTEVKPNFSDRMMRWLEARYRPLLEWALRRKAVVLTSAVALFVGSILLFRTLGGEFIPQLSEGDFAIELRTLTGSSLSYTVDRSLQAGAILQKQFPEVKEVVAKIGAAEIPTDPMPVEAADVMVILEKDQDKWTSAKTQEELAGKMAEALSVIPGVTFGFQQPIQMRFNELISGAKQDVVLKIYGEDLQQLASYAERAARLVRQVEGAEDVYVEQVTGLPQIVVKLDRNRLARFGLNAEDVNRTVQTAFAGQTAGQLFEQERRFDVVLRLAPELRQNIGNVRQLLVATPGGEQIPLEQVAAVDLLEGPNQIQRDDAKRRITVAFNVRGRDVESVVTELQGKVDQQLQLAPGYYTTYGGQFENLRKASERLSIAVPVALLLIFVLLFFTFKSFKQSILIFTAIPLSAIGGVLALWLRGMPFSISAGVGFIALFGVAVLNGIVLIGYFNQLKEEGRTDVFARILEGTQVRLRPVLMTATVASLGFLPMALSQSAGAEVQRPLATVVIGGLVTATLLTLLVLPVLYALSERNSKAKEEEQPQRTPAVPVSLVLLVLGGLLAAAPARAQGPLTSTQAVGQALQANGTVQGAQRALEAQQALRRTAFDVGRTTILGTYGQVNSPLSDNVLSIGQSLALPGYYRAQAGLSQAQIGGREQQLAQVQAELRRQVRLSYERAVHARHRLRTLRGQDSIYTEFLRAAQLRFKTGEVARLEPANALIQQGETQNLLAQARADYAVAQRQLQALLQTNGPVAIADSVLRLLPAPGGTVDTATLAATPQARVLQQQIAERRAETRVEQAQGLPQVTVGYTNQSLRGTYEVDGRAQTYGTGDRFQSVQAGVAIPLLRGPQKARVQAAKLQEQVATTAYQRYQAEAAAQLDELRLRLAEQQRRVQFYEQTGLPQAAVIVRLSQRAYKAGETTYSELLLNLERALSVRTAYLDALLQHNQTAIDLDYLLGTAAQ
ncbi:CusA/CzcA family heavy metal efflux RND transporter [Hymenobacter sp. BT175]|uniref:CusA/CzcA family heavy metal efflux RND transporter n=1 Tax=Hymenobacter TaxID=89966 RepID=UPI0016518099|nr:MULTISPECIES: CusA/CzcA family heavy metal efflux RND transporter [Hymenobacter]MBC6700274.1 CusA/CzcA family heavy metal efflux RND transporter [Hymenobacter sp. BT190]MCC2548730.1 CusA/CzcA family heavy metal efflux RND transporter [Hymenobacter translucens]MCR5890610.1 CusA/CzcA family heavy metal efflux RND transporter [Hymenobacter sp. J193]